MRRTAVYAALLALASHAAFSQAQPKPAFEAASIKPSNPGDPLKGAGAADIAFSPGNLTAQNATVKDLIAAAYRVRDYQIAGPSALESARYDILAKAAGGVAEDQQRQMLQTLLAERFGLVLHRETKDLPVYVLSAGKNPSFPKSKRDGPSNLKILGANMLFLNYTMAKLAEFLSVRADRPVVNETGLEGQYDLTVQFAEPNSSPVEIKVALAKSRSDGSLSATVTSQLGLKLDPRKSAIEVLVIDHADKPSAN